MSHESCTAGIELLPSFNLKVGSNQINAEIIDEREPQHLRQSITPTFERLLFTGKLVITPMEFECTIDLVMILQLEGPWF